MDIWRRWGWDAIGASSEGLEMGQLKGWKLSQIPKEGDGPVLVIDSTGHRLTTLQDVRDSIAIPDHLLSKCDQLSPGALLVLPRGWTIARCS